MEVSSGGLVEDALGAGGGCLGGSFAGSPEDDIQLGRSCGSDEVWGFFEALMEFQCGGVAGFEALSEGATARVGEQLLGGP